MRFDKDIFKKSLRIGLPSGFQQTFVSVGFLALYKIVNTFGVNTIAAYSIAMRIDSFAIMPAMNFSAAISTFVGQNIGANKFERIGKGLKATLIMISLISLTVTFFAVIFAKPLMEMFTNNPDVVDIGRQYIYIVTPFYIIFSTMFIFNGVLRGAGDTLIPMVITIIALWIVRLPVSWWLSGKIGSTGIWWGIPIAWVFGVTLAYFYYLSGRWKKRAVVKHESTQT